MASKKILIIIIKKQLKDLSHAPKKQTRLKGTCEKRRAGQAGGDPVWWHLERSGHKEEVQETLRTSISRLSRLQEGGGWPLSGNARTAILEFPLHFDHVAQAIRNSTAQQSVLGNLILREIERSLHFKHGICM